MSQATTRHLLRKTQWLTFVTAGCLDTYSAGSAGICTPLSCSAGHPVRSARPRELLLISLVLYHKAAKSQPSGRAFISHHAHLINELLQLGDHQVRRPRSGAASQRCDGQRRSSSLGIAHSQDGVNSRCFHHRHANDLCSSNLAPDPRSRTLWDGGVCRNDHRIGHHSFCHRSHCICSIESLLIFSLYHIIRVFDAI